MEGIATSTFIEIVLNEFQDALLSFFGNLGSGFSGFLSLENRLVNDTFFMKNRISRPGSGLADPWVFGPSKDIKA